MQVPLDFLKISLTFKSSHETFKFKFPQMLIGIQKFSKKMQIGFLQEFLTFSSSSKSSRGFLKSRQEKEV